MYVQLLNAATATNGAPSLSSHGFALQTPAASVNIAGDKGLLLVHSTAGSDTMAVTIRLWGYSAISPKRGLIQWRTPRSSAVSRISSVSMRKSPPSPARTPPSVDGW